MSAAQGGGEEVDASGRDRVVSKSGVVPEHDSLPGVRKEGWLTKEGRVRKTWKLRQFRIEAGRLIYLTAQGVEKGHVFLVDAEVNEDADLAPTSFSAEAGAPADVAALEFAHRFRVSSAGRVLRVAASSSGERAAWIAAVKDAVSVENYLALCHGFGIPPLADVVAAFRERSNALRVSGVTLGLDAIRALGCLLQSNETLTSVALERCGVADAGCEPVAEALAVNNSVRSLSLAGNRVSNAAVVELNQALYVNISLTSMDLSDNEIGDDGVSQLCDMLLSNAFISKLDLSGNLLGPESAARIADVLPINSTLRYLSVSRNALGDEGLTCLADGVAVSGSLERLYTAQCGAGADGCRAIADAVRRNPRIRKLDLSGNAPDESTASAIAEALAASASGSAKPGLSRVLLGGNQTLGPAAVAVAPGLASGNFVPTKLVMTRPG